MFSLDDPGDWILNFLAIVFLISLGQINFMNILTIQGKNQARESEERESHRGEY